MTDWITPKTNWGPGDYFNLEDMVRISNNIQYLKEKAASLVPNDTIMFLGKDEVLSGYTFYRKLDLTVSNIQVHTTFSYGSVSLLAYFSNNLFALCQISILLSQTISMQSNILVDDHTPYKTSIPSSWTPTHYYNGYGVLNGTLSVIDTIWGFLDTFSQVRCPFNIVKRNNINHEKTALLDLETSPLLNDHFWTYEELNTIENWIYIRV